jgi:hypothetical protein
MKRLKIGDIVTTPEGPQAELVMPLFGTNQWTVKRLDGAGEMMGPYDSKDLSIYEEPRPVQVYETRVTLIIMTMGRSPKEAAERAHTVQYQAYGGGARIEEEMIGRTRLSHRGYDPEEIDE